MLSPASGGSCYPGGAGSAPLLQEGAAPSPEEGLDLLQSPALGLGHTAAREYQVDQADGSKEEEGHLQAQGSLGEWEGLSPSRDWQPDFLPSPGVPLSAFADLGLKIPPAHPLMGAYIWALLPPCLPIASIPSVCCPCPALQGPCPVYWGLSATHQSLVLDSSWSQGHLGLTLGGVGA